MDDPIDWTVDEVVAFVCRSSDTSWSLSRNPSRPDPIAFEATLRENQVTGDVLLTAVDNAVLKEELGLKALGPRKAVLDMIHYLRQRSVKYKMACEGPNQPVGSPAMTSRAASITAGSPLLQHGGLGLSHQNLHPIPLKLGEFSFSPQRAQQGAATGPDIPRAGVSPVGGLLQTAQPRPDAASEASYAVDTDQTQITRSPRAKRPVEQRQFTPDNQVPSRAHESVVVDAQGRKRRRLELGPTHPVSAKSYYMGPRKLEAADVFYPIQPDSEESQASDDFVLTGAQVPPAQRLFVSKQLQHLFRQLPRRLTSPNGSSRVAILPCRGDSTYFTLYSSKDGCIEVTQEKITDWPELGQTGRAERDDLHDYILAKYPPEKSDEGALPVFGESDTDGAYDSDTWREIEEEQLENQKLAQSKANELTDQDMNTIISRCISDYQQEWKTNHLPKHQHKAYHIWMTAARKKNRSSQIKILQLNIAHLETRLRTIQRELLKTRYTRVPDLENQCRSMEQTVFQIEANKWRVSVLEGSECPPKLAAPSVTSRKAKRPGPRQEDEESLDSESDDMNLGDFIVHDDDQDYDMGFGVGPQDEEHPAPGPERPSEAVTQQRPEVGRHTPALGLVMESSDSDDFEALSPGRRRARKTPQEGSRATSSSRLPSTVRKDHSATNRLPQTAMDLAGENIEVVDLTASRDGTPDDIKTPPLNPTRTTRDTALPDLVLENGKPSPSSKNQEPGRNEGPDSSDDDHYASRRIQDISWLDLMERPNRKMFLAKLVWYLDRDEREKIIDLVERFSIGRFKRLTKAGLSALLDGSRKVDGYDRDMSQAILRIAVLYISWHKRHRLTEGGILKSFIKEALATIREERDEPAVRFDRFYRHLVASLHACVFTQTHSAKAAPEGRRTSLPGGSPRQGQPEQSAEALMPHKQRKREIRERKEVKSGYEAARRRAALQEQSRLRLQQRMEQGGVSNTDPERQPVTFDDPVIYLHPHIGGRVLPHQLSGVQFMWRELIQDEKREGCLLAHTMGLGKTMQVISLLVTIAAAANSPDEAIRRQVPEKFHRSSTLILCPSSLVDNWHDEFLMWTPSDHALGPVRKITATDSVRYRIEEVDSWYKEGGVLILSYDIFRALVWRKNGDRDAGEQSPVDRTREQLLEGPSIIVADEAHRLKNPSSKLSKATSQFKSRSRIALTGSPLANSFVDYFFMVDWIAPGYLGEFVEFKANYIEPIVEGLYIDSTQYERRKSLKKLQVLKLNLEPKINRADISVLKGKLPPKVEFVITVPLTDVQKEAYNIYAKSLLRENSGQSVSATHILSWLHVLSLCCNHPYCFYQKLLKQAEDPSPNDSSDEGAQEQVRGDKTTSAADDAMRAAQSQLLSSVPDLDDPKYSHRTAIFLRIVAESVKAGDKVLCFSHSLPTLNYLERLLQSSKTRYCRLDGQTPTAVRQTTTKEFNRDSDMQVYLISTRAGGLGLNIFGANRVILFDFNFNPTWEEQAVGRAYRLGQTKPVYVYHFIAGGTFEEVVHNKSIFKTQLALRVVDKKNVVRLATRSLNDYVFPVKDVERQDLSEHVGKDVHVLDKILNDDATKHVIRKIALTETFAKEDNDKLTEEENKAVQEEVDLERLRRTDKAAYERKLEEIRRRDMMAAVPLNWQMPPNGSQSAVLEPPHLAGSGFHSSSTQSFVHPPSPPPPSSSRSAPSSSNSQPAGTLPPGASQTAPPPLAPEVIGPGRQGASPWPTASSTRSASPASASQSGSASQCTPSRPLKKVQYFSPKA